MSFAPQGPDAPLKIEAGMIALGAVGTWCLEHLASAMPKLMHFLNANLKHASAPVVSQACWVLGEFARWLVEQALEGNTKPLHYTTNNLLPLFNNPKKSLQSAVGPLDVQVGI